MRLKDRVAIVTGGGRGIGRSIAEHIAKEGGKVVVSDIDLAAAQETVAKIRAQGGEAHAVKADVTCKADVQAMAVDAKRTYGRIDILVNNAGTDKKGAITELSEETWDMLLDLNLKGTFLCTQAVMQTMIDQHYGRIVNISSMAGKTGEPLTSPYNASKFGVIGFTQAVALEVGKHNVTINVVCPGPVDTELIRKSVSMSAAIKGVTPEQFMQEFFIGPTPMGRLAQPADVARAVVFLASDEAEFITGSSLNVSGGREMH
jgi:NAD(P)-dependent dehydrogenase (short-subunit alcohol dehydrogenase family)